MAVASVIIIHGYRGVPDDIWKPWLKQELIARDVAVALPAMPDPDDPSETVWIDTIDRLTAQAETPIVAIGHSLGWLAIQRYLETRATQPIHGAVAIAPVVDPTLMDPSYYRFARSWRPTTDWRQVKAMAKTIVALHSHDDTLVPFRHAELLNDAAGATLYAVDGYNHFSEGTTNPKEVPELLQIVDTLIQLAK